MARYFPIALAVEGRTCVVVGGGVVAERRVLALLDAGARVTVIAPDVTERIAASNAIVRREFFNATHLEGAHLVIAATDDPDVNALVVRRAQVRRILCCDAAEPDAGDFIVPSAVRRGELLLAITTGGSSPALTARIKADLESRYGIEYSDYVSLLAEARSLAKRKIGDEDSRREILRGLAEDDSILDMIRCGRMPEARERVMSCISSSSD